MLLTFRYNIGYISVNENYSTMANKLNAGARFFGREMRRDLFDMNI